MGVMVLPPPVMAPLKPRSRTMKKAAPTKYLNMRLLVRFESARGALAQEMIQGCGNKEGMM